MKVTIFAKLFFTFSILTTAVALVGYIAFDDIGRIIDSFGKGEHHYASIVDALTESGSYAKRAEGHLLMYLSLHDEADRGRFFSRCGSLSAQLHILDSTIQESEARSKLEILRQRSEEILPIGQLLLHAFDDARSHHQTFHIGDHAELVRTFFNTTSNVRQLSVELAKHEVAVESENKALALLEAARFQNRLLLWGVFLFVSAFVLSYAVARLISRPIARLKQMAVQVGESNFAARTDVASDDEIGVLGNSLNEMAWHLQHFEIRLRDKEQELVKANQQLTEMNERLLESERIFDAFMRHSPVYVFFMDDRMQALRLSANFGVLLGRPVQELQHRRMEDLFPSERMKRLFSEDAGQLEVGNDIVSEEQINGRQYSIIRFSIDVAGHRRSLAGYMIDITERANAEEKVKRVLQEKSILLKEVHHRIKNNMNTIMSLLSLQSESLKDPTSVTALKEARSRVKSMAVLYDRLYRSADFRDLTIEEYLSTLVDDIAETFPNRGYVTIVKEFDECTLDAKRLSPLGIIVNELLTNAMKYAFGGKRTGTIRIAARRKENRITLRFEDDGVGIPAEIDLAHASTFGMQLIELLTQQIGGVMQLIRDHGTKFELSFSV